MNGGATIILSGLLAQYLPIENDMVRMQLGLFIHEVLSRGLNNTSGLQKLLRYFKKTPTQVIVKNYLKQECNPIYQSFEEFLIRNHSVELEGCELVPKNGDIELTINQDCQLNGVSYCHEGHSIQVKIEASNNDDNNNTSGKPEKQKNHQIVISSKTASTEDLRQFVKEKCKSTPIQSQILKVYRSYSGPTKDSRTTWEQIYIKTNKSLTNTIVSKSVERDLYDDTKWFLENEEWYSEKGIPYKRGYILHGPPGTGKTSIIKAIANEYHLPIFSIDLSSIPNNNDLVQLITDINYYVQDGRYILTFEDVDRTNMFRNAKYSYIKKDLSADCLLNVIDGVMETHGRIIFVTANNVTPLTEMEAFIRPGRIDKKILIDYCDSYQFNKMITNFYCSAELTIQLIAQIIQDTGVTCPSNLAPANLVDKMQQYPDINDFIGFIQGINNNGNTDTEFLCPVRQTNNITTSNSIQNRLRRASKYQNRTLKRHQSSLRRSRRLSERLATKVIPKTTALIAKTKVRMEKEKLLVRKIQQDRKRGGPYCSAKTKRGLPCQKPVKIEGSCCRYHG